MIKIEQKTKKTPFTPLAKMASVKYVVAAIAAIAFGVFVMLAQYHAILVPYFSPAKIEVQGLESAYRADAPIQFDVLVRGYGSNCHMLEIEAVHEGQRVSYYKKADDCRFMEITQDKYNLTRSFEYKDQVLEKIGVYTINVRFEDLINQTNADMKKTFEVRQ
jgi:hypothetical protein